MNDLSCLRIYNSFYHWIKKMQLEAVFCFCKITFFRIFHPDVFCKKRCSEKSCKIQKKHLCRSHFFIMLQQANLTIFPSINHCAFPELIQQKFANWRLIISFYHLFFLKLFSCMNHEGYIVILFEFAVILDFLDQSNIRESVVATLFSVSR